MVFSHCVHSTTSSIETSQAQTEFFPDESLSQWEMVYGKMGEGKADGEKRLLLAVLNQATEDVRTTKTNSFWQQQKQDAEQWFRDVEDKRITSLNYIADILGVDADPIRVSILGSYEPLLF